MVKRLRRRHPKTGRQKSLRAISREIADLGYRNVHGEPFAAESTAGISEDNSSVRYYAEVPRQAATTEEWLAGNPVAAQRNPKADNDKQTH